MFNRSVSLILLLCAISSSAAKSKSYLQQNKMCRQTIRGPDHGFKLLNATTMLCAEVCTIFECTEYFCVDGVCCTPGSPESLCCPDDHPLCVAEGCCAAGHPEVCGDLCCTITSTCCGDDCCDTAEGEVCCGVKCCDAGKTCCAGSCCDEGDKCCGTHCCKVSESCCGNSCCDSNTETCCGGSCCENGNCCNDKCCDGSNQVCCGGIGCNNMCPSIFEIKPCPGPSEKIVLKNVRNERSSKERHKPVLELYRLLRNGESCTTMVSEAPTASYAVQDHILCQPNIKTQYLAFTSNLSLATTWYHLYKTKNSTGGLAKVAITSIPSTCTIYNLTDPLIRPKYLTNSLAVKKAVAQSAYLVDVPNGKWITGICIPPMYVPRFTHDEKKSSNDKLISEFDMNFP